jgi:DNA-binding beta-propeller fold protein YncE
MSRRRLCLLAVVAGCLCLLSSVQASDPTITWRSADYWTTSPAVAPDGSWWVTTLPSADLAKLSPTGEELWRKHVFGRVDCIAMNSADGSAWVLNGGAGQIAHLAADGTVLWSDSGLEFEGVGHASVNAADGSIWISRFDEVIHLAADGTELWRGSCPGIHSVSVNPNDGSCWVAADDPNSIAHLSAGGAVLWQATLTDVPCVVVDPADNTCWAIDLLAYQVVHFAPDGTELWRGGDFDWPAWISLDPSDGSVWVADEARNCVVHISADGESLPLGEPFEEVTYLVVSPVDGTYWALLTDEIARLARDGSFLWRNLRFSNPMSVSTNSSDGSCWVADSGLHRVLHLSSAGEKLVAAEGFQYPVSVSVRVSDGSCWVADSGLLQVVHLAENGAELLRVGGFDRQPIQVEVDQVDGSCWVADYPNQVVHLAEDGAVLGRNTSLQRLEGIGANWADGSCWGTDSYTYEVIHLAGDGTELWRGGGFFGPKTVSVYPLDGSCWVGEHGGFSTPQIYMAGDAILLGPDGAELSRCELANEIYAASVNADGMCWVTDHGDDGEVFLVARDGTPVWYTGAFANPPSISANLADGSVWISDWPHAQVTRFMTPDWHYPTFQDVNVRFWAYDQVEACVTRDIVGGYPDGNYRPSLPVARDAMAVFISRALAGGDSLVPTGPATATFPDVPTNDWAFRYVEYAVDHGVVAGYEDGTYRPALTVTRDQMAVFIARAIMGGEEYVPTGPETASFPDVPTDHWAFRYVECIRREGVAGGYDDGTYRPLVAVTRDQMAVYIQRAFDLPV